MTSSSVDIPPITTGPNFPFIQKSFCEAKDSLNREKRTGVSEPDRLKGIGLEGASRTGKSWDICVFLCYYVTWYEGKQINVCRDHLTTLKKTFYETLKQVWGLSGLPLSHFNKSATPIYFNNNVIKFVGVNDDIMVAHGLESDLLIVNEAMGIAKDTADQLEQRCTEFFIYDYNPSAIDSWLFDLEKRDDYKCKHTTIFDNPYAPANAKAKILSYAHPDCDDEHIAVKAGYKKDYWKKIKERNVLLGTADKFTWEVYGLGLRSVSEDIIFQSWQLYSDEVTDYDWKVYGGDFGYRNDPTTYIEVVKSGSSLYIREHVYETGLLNNEIARKIHSLGVNNEISVWDSSEMKSIEELRLRGINADAAVKGPDSVAYGIQLLSQFKIFVHVDSLNVQDELRKYRWAKDRQGNYKRNSSGKRIPVDKDNHAIDALRYGISYYFDPEKEE